MKLFATSGSPRIHVYHEIRPISRDASAAFIFTDAAGTHGQLHVQNSMSLRNTTYMVMKSSFPTFSQFPN